MNLVTGKEGYESFCGTSYASKLLGLSIGTIQGLVSRKELRAWRTNGGHRRISMKSIQEYQRKHNLQPNAFMHNLEHIKIVVVEDDEPTRVMLQLHFDKWGLPLEVVMYESAIEAMLDIPSFQPQVLLTDLVMPRVDGFALIRTLNEHASLKSLTVVAMTGLQPKQIQSKGGLPEGVHVMHKPLDLGWLRGFLGGFASVKQVNQRFQAAKLARTN